MLFYNNSFFSTAEERNIQLFETFEQSKNQQSGYH